jgi:uncharacterized membrane protein
VLIFWGILFSLYLTYLEAFVIEAFCLWCLGSFANIILITLINFLGSKTQEPSLADSEKLITKTY